MPKLRFPCLSSMGLCFGCLLRRKSAAFRILLLLGLLLLSVLNYFSSKTKISVNGSSSLQKQSIFDTCPAFMYYFNDSRILRRLGPAPEFHCSPVELLTSLKEGKMEINPNFADYRDYKCRARCAYYDKDYANKYGDWCEFVREKCSYPCDVVDVECTKNGTLDYVFVHSQIYEYNRDRRLEFGNLYRETLAPKISKARFHPSVHILLFDSMGLFPVLRQFPNTVAFLREKLEAVTFERYTRTAGDSRFNALTAFFGEISIDVDQRLYGGGIREKTLPDNHCELPMDDRNYIQFEYEDAGYKTMYAQDGSRTTFGYLACEGIKNQLATHYMRPFRLLEMLKEDTSNHKAFWGLSFARDPLLRKYLRNEGHCEDLHTHALDYTTKFIEAYKGIPKMSITWMSIGHGEETDARRAEADLQRFLHQHKETLDDSFFILMADHGQRFSKLSSSQQGQFETNNPAMLFSLPKRLRGSKLHEIVKNNSKALLSHHDLYATLVDIIRHQPATDFNDTKFRPIEKSFGNSWLRELDPNVPRSCRHLPISSQFCTCNYGMKAIPKSDKIWNRLKEILGRDMNNHLQGAGLADQCMQLRVLNIISIHQMSAKDDLTVYRVLFKSVTGGIFVAQYSLTREDKWITSLAAWKRVNRYGNASDCLDSKYGEYKPMCQCKTLS